MRLLTVGVATVACAVIVGGCQSQSSTTFAPPIDATGVSASQAARKNPAEYLLRQSDVPAGYEQQQIPVDKARSVADSLLDSTKASTVTPGSCKPDISGSTTGQVANAPLAIFIDNDTLGTIVSTANPSSSSSPDLISTFRRYNLGACASRVVSSVDGTSFTATQRTSELDIDVPGVRQALSVRSETTTRVRGAQTATSVQYVTLIAAPGATVLVGMNSITGPPPSETVFRQVVAASAKRITG